MTKKSFTESAVMQFVTPAAEAQAQPETAKPAKRKQAKTEPAEEAAPQQITRQAPEFKASADRYEPRSRRVQLLMRPSIYAGIQYIAKRNRQSTNNLIETVLADYIEQVKMLDEQKKKG